MKIFLIIIFLLCAITVRAQQCPQTVPEFTFNHYGPVTSGDILGNVNVCDEDFNTTFKWDIPQGNENNLFYIEDGYIYVANANKINKDTVSYHIIIRVSDNGTPALSQTSLIDIIMTRDLDVLVYPNPFIDQFKIRYYVSIDSKVTLRIFDVHGRLVDMPVNAHENAGIHEVTIKSLVAPGIYFYEILIDKFIKSGKIVKSNLR